MTEPPTPSPRFLTLDDQAAELNVSRTPANALVRGPQLRALKIGGRGQWRVERVDLEAYITQSKTDTDGWIETHPFTGSDDDDGE